MSENNRTDRMQMSFLAFFVPAFLIYATWGVMITVFGTTKIVSLLRAGDDGMWTPVILSILASCVSVVGLFWFIVAFFSPKPTTYCRECGKKRD